MYNMRMLVLILALICMPYTVLAEESSNGEAKEAAPEVKKVETADVQAAEPATGNEANTPPENTPEQQDSESLYSPPVEDAVKAKEEVAAKKENDDEVKAEVKEEEKEKGIKAMVLVTTRTSVGMLGKDMIAEYGVQVEIAAKHFGIKAHFAKFQPYPDNVNFCFDVGFSFHYYYFGDGPSGLYVGPGFTFMQMFQHPDPMRGIQAELRKRLVRENLAANPSPDGARLPPMDPVDSGMIVNQRTGWGHQFNLMTPVIDLGYRHRWPEYESPVYFTLGIELTVGYAVSDQANHWDSGFLWTLNPQAGLTW